MISSWAGLILGVAVAYFCLFVYSAHLASGRFMELMHESRGMWGMSILAFVPVCVVVAAPTLLGAPHAFSLTVYALACAAIVIVAGVWRGQRQKAKAEAARATKVEG